MILISLAVLGTFLVFQNCGAPVGLAEEGDASGNTSLGSSSATIGLDLSGTWSLKQLRCYDSNLTKVTTTATFADLSENLTITGNLLRRTINQGGCTVEASMGAIFQTSFIQITNEVVNSATGGNCVVNYSLSNSQIFPTVSNVNYASAEKVLPAQRGLFFNLSKYNGIQELALIGDYSNAQREYCLKIYQKN